MRLWRPRSILQLVLIGFFTVLAPLFIAIAYTALTFDRLANNHQRTALHLVQISRANQNLRTASWELERRAGQYVALSEQPLLELYQREHQALLNQFDSIELLLDEERRFRLLPIRELLKRIEVAIVAPESLFSAENLFKLFDSLNQRVEEFQQASQQYVDEKLKLQGEEAVRIQTALLWMVTGLGLFTLLSALLFIYWINRPVRQLERNIERLGAGELSEPLSISGPQEIQQLGQRLDWLRQQLAELDEQKQQFLRHMSHELKTPLASLREGTDLLADGVGGALAAGQQEIVGIMQQNGSELQRLIENLLDYNQLLHQHHLVLESVGISDLWHDVLSSYFLLIERKSLYIDCQQDSLSWSADRAKLRTIFDNLLSNAVNYSPEGGLIRIRWHIDDWQVDKKVFYCDVGNSGDSIAATDRERLFEPFYQGRNSRQGAIKGSGIGLSVARECARAHGGQLILLDESMPGAEPPLGVCFRLQLPDRPG